MTKHSFPARPVATPTIYVFASTHQEHAALKLDYELPTRAESRSLRNRIV